MACGDEFVERADLSSLKVIGSLVSQSMPKHGTGTIKKLDTEIVLS